MATDKQIFADRLYKAAAYFRTQAAELQKAHTVKCAQVLTAARGLAQFKRILRGAKK